MAIKISGTTVIDDSRNFTNVGNFGDSNTVYTGSGANLSGIEAGSKNFTASGAISNGRALVLNSDGTVSQPTKSAGGGPVLSSNIRYSGEQLYNTTMTFDSTNNKVILAYRDGDDSSKGKAKVGTISGNSISWGSSVTFDTNTIADTAICYDSTNNRVVIFYEQSSAGYAVVGTVSGTSISFGSRVEFGSNVALHAAGCCFDSDNGRVVVAYRDWDNSSYGTVKVGNVSGTSVSFGSATVFRSAACQYIALTYDTTASSVVFAYQDQGNASYGKMVHGTVGGTPGTVTINSSDFTLGSLAKAYIWMDHDASSGYNIVTYQDDGNSQKGRAQAVKVDGNSFSSGNQRTFDENQVRWTHCIHDSVNGVTNIFYLDDTDSFQIYGLVARVENTPGTNDEGNLTFSNVFLVDSEYHNHTSAAYDSNAGKTVVTTIPNNYSGKNADAYILDNTGMNVFVRDGDPVQFESGSTNNMDSCYDPTSKKLIITYRDSSNSSKGTAVVGTLTKDGITFGTPVVFNSGNTEFTSVIMDTTNDKVVISFMDAGASDHGKAIVGTISGTSISFGSEVTFNNSVTYDCDSIFDPDNGKVLISYRDNGDNQRGKVIVGTVSGTSISFGSATAYTTDEVSRPRITYDTNSNKAVVAFRHNGSSDHGKAVVGTVSGTSISFGSLASFQSSAIDNPAICFDSTNNKVVIAYKHPGDNDRGKVVVGTVSGTSISFGTVAMFDDLSVAYAQLAYSPQSDRFVISYRSSDTNGRAVLGKVDGTDVLLCPALTFKTGNIGGGDTEVTSTHIPTLDKVVTSYKDNDDSSKGKSSVMTVGSTNITSDNFIGVAAAAISDGASGEVTIVGGTNASQSSLTVAKKQYVQFDGTLDTSNTGVEAGISISSTQVIVGS